MKKQVITFLKVAVLAVVAVVVGREFYKVWGKMDWKAVSIDWRWGVVGVAGFCGSMLTSAIVWRWLAVRMGDRSAAVPLVGAYTFSQMGKYIPGKVALLLMRIERAGRFGMGAGVCTLSTLLENALYVISGGLVGMTTVVRVLEEMRARGVISEQQQQWQWPVMVAAIVGLMVVCQPAVFYGVVNRVLRKLKKGEVPVGERLGMGTLAVAVVGFVPCWALGGLALWASTMCVHRVEIGSCWWFAGAYALSVILGMVSLLPGGLGIRDLVLGIAVTVQLSPVLGHEQAVAIGGVAAVLQRLFQLVAEVVMGVLGGVVTARRKGDADGGAGMMEVYSKGADHGDG